MTGARQLDRDVYDLLVNKHPEGLPRESLLSALGVDDRTMRESVERVRVLAATIAHSRKGYRIVGFDPATKRYVDAQTPDQAERVMAYAHVRVKSLVDGLNAMLNAYQSQYDELPPEREPMQGTLFDANKIGRRVSHALGGS